LLQQSSGVTSIIDRRGERLSPENARFTYELFPGFLHALKACHVGWNGITVEGASLGPRPAFNPNQLLTVNTSHDLWNRANDLLYSPNMPILRRHSRVSEGSTFADIPATNSTIYRNALYHSGTAYYSMHQQKTSRVNRCRAHQPFEFQDERSLARAARAAARAVRDMALGEEMEEESAESGQESEDGPSRPANSRQMVAPADGEEVN
uniref:Uncharacterized protein n=1 Tax=Parascaris equorum TaxID=6256 RepID=A0A914SAQ7_PAREQ